MNWEFEERLAFTNMDFNFTWKKQSFTTKRRKWPLVQVHLSLSCSSPIVNLNLPVVVLFFACDYPVFHLKDEKRSENERKTALILVLRHFKGNLFETCSKLIRFQMELVRHLFETCMKPKGRKKEQERTRNGFDSCFIAFQTGLVWDLFGPYTSPKWSCAGSVRALWFPKRVLFEFCSGLVWVLKGFVK